MNNGLIARLVINDRIIENDNTLDPNIQSLIIEEVTTQRNNLALGICAINRLTSVIKNPKDLSLSGAKVKVFVKKPEEGTEIAEVEPLADDTVLFVDETYIDDDDVADIANTVAQINQNELKAKEIEVRQYFGYADNYPLSEGEILAKYDEMTASDSTESEGNPQDSVAEDATVYSEADDTSTAAPDTEVAIHDNSDIFGENSFSNVNEEDVEAESALIDEETVSDGWIPAGEFTIASAVPNGESIKITAYDNMYKLTGKYVPTSRELTNVSDYYEDLRSQIFNKYGITVLDTSLPEIYLTWNIDCTYREALGYIAGLVGGIATCNRKGEIETKTYGYTSTQIQNFDSYTETSDQMALIEAISVDTVGLGNPADYVVEGESDNPLWFSDPLYGEIATYADPDVEGGDDTEITAQTVLNDVYTSLSSLNYQPCTVVCDWDTGLEVTRLVKLLTPEDIEEKMKLLNQLANGDEEAQELLKDEIDALGRYICISNQTIDLIAGKTQIKSIGENSEQITARNFETETDKKVKRMAPSVRFSRDVTGAIMTLFKIDEKNGTIKLQAGKLLEILSGGQLIVEADNYSLNKDGTVTITGGQIGGFVIDNNNIKRVDSEGNLFELTGGQAPGVYYSSENGKQYGYFGWHTGAGALTGGLEFILIDDSGSTTKVSLNESFMKFLNQTVSNNQIFVRYGLDGIRTSGEGLTVDDNPVACKTREEVIEMINLLGTGTDTPKDDDYYISQYVGGGETTKTYHRRKLKYLWNYIKSKADSVYEAVITTLPISKGGTGETNRLESLTLSSVKGTGSHGCRYYPYLKMCFLRMQVTGVAVEQGKITVVGVVPSGYRPSYINALSVYYSGYGTIVKASINSSGEIRILSSAALGTSASVYVTGWWIVS